MTVSSPAGYTAAAENNALWVTSCRVGVGWGRASISGFFLL